MLSIYILYIVRIYTTISTAMPPIVVTPARGVQQRRGVYSTAPQTRSLSAGPCRTHTYGYYQRHRKASPRRIVATPMTTQLADLQTTNSSELSSRRAAHRDRRSRRGWSDGRLARARTVTWRDRIAIITGL
jgi:hypothetical protein